VLDAVLQYCRDQNRQLLRMVIADILQVGHEVVLFWREREGFLVLVKIREGDAMYIAHHMMIHAMDQKKGTQLV
jgi:hypothetical protein